jgi:hypothetical protein
LASDAKLLQNDEAGQTTGRILRAAKDGATSYVGIAGKTRELTCPLAFDAGYTLGYRHPEKEQPGALTPAEAAAITRACYDPSATEISVKGTATVASKAGLLAGAYFGRQARTQTQAR